MFPWRKIQSTFFLLKFSIWLFSVGFDYIKNVRRQCAISILPNYRSAPRPYIRRRCVVELQSSVALIEIYTEWEREREWEWERAKAAQHTASVFSTMFLLLYSHHFQKRSTLLNWHIPIYGIMRMTYNVKCRRHIDNNKIIIMEWTISRECANSLVCECFTSNICVTLLWPYTHKPIYWFG